MELALRLKRNFPLALPTGLAAGLAGFVLLALPAKWLLAFIAGSLLFLAGLFSRDRQRFLLTLLALSLPLALFNTTLFARREYFGVPGLSVGVIEVLIGLVYLRWIAGGRFGDDLVAFFRSTPGILSGVYFLTVSLSVYGAYDRTLAFFGLFALLKAYLLFIYLACNLRSYEQIDVIIMALLVGTIFQAWLGIAQFVSRTPIGLTAFGESPEVMMMTFGGKAFPRIAGTLVHPNQLSNFLGLQLPFALSYMLIGRQSRERNIVYGLVFIFGVVTFLLTFSRTGWFHLIASSLVVLTLAAWQGKISRQTWTYLTLVALAAIVVLLIFSGNIILRLTQSDPELVTSRFDMLRVAWRVFTNSPWMGVGVNNYVNVLPRFNYLQTMVAPVHNVYFLLLAETGVIGLAAWLLFLFSQIALIWRTVTTPDPRIAAAAVGIVGALAGFLVDGVSDFSYILPSTFYMFWLLMAVIIAVDRLAGLRRGNQ